MSRSPLSKSKPSEVSPALEKALRTYENARVTGGVTQDAFDVLGARTALKKTERLDAVEQKPRKQLLGGVACVVCGTQDPTLIFLHGGGFVGGNWNSHAHIVDALSRELKCTALFPEYRLAPEHAFPAAFDDVENVFDALPSDRGVSIVGDSVGAALAMHLAKRARFNGAPRIDAMALIAPMLDFDPTASNYMRNYPRAHQMISQSIHSHQLSDPRARPLDGDLSRLPPILIQVGGNDYVRDDGLRLAERLSHGGSPCVFEFWPNMPHVWQRYLPDAPEALSSVRRIAAFLAAHKDRN